MAAYKLKEPIPFNDFVFKSCYYHQLLAGLSVLDIEKDGILIQRFLFTQENFSTAEKVIFTDKEAERAMGFALKKSRLNERRLKRAIQKGYPLIVGVDSFYFKSRDESYSKHHDLHFILVYGFDDEKDEAYAVDHDYRNGMYSLKTLSLKNVLYASKMLKTGVKKSKYNCRIIQKRENAQKFSLKIWDYITEEELQNSRRCSQENIKELKRMFESDVAALQENSLKIEQYCKDLKAFYFAFSKTRLFQNAENAAIVNGIIGAYNVFVSLFWKMHVKNKYTHDESSLEKILRKADMLDALEEQLLNIIKGAKQ